MCWVDNLVISPIISPANTTYATGAACDNTPAQQIDSRIQPKFALSHTKYKTDAASRPTSWGGSHVDIVSNTF